MPISTLRPNSFEQFALWRDKGHSLQLTCLQCKNEFSPDNTHTPAGWRETQITGWCEDCFDEVFEKEEEDWEDE